MKLCKICGVDMTEGVVHPRVDCNGVCMACCATVNEFPYHIHQLIAWYHRGKMMNRLNELMNIIANCMQLTRELGAINDSSIIHFVYYEAYQRQIRAYNKLAYYWEQFSYDSIKD